MHYAWWICALCKPNIIIIKIPVSQFICVSGTLPEDASLMMHTLLMNHYVYGGFYPRGGASEIAYHIVPVIEKAGGRVLVRAPVSEILIDSDGAACGELKLGMTIE